MSFNFYWQYARVTGCVVLIGRWTSTRTGNSPDFINRKVGTTRILYVNVVGRNLELEVLIVATEEHNRMLKPSISKLWQGTPMKFRRLGLWNLEFSWPRGLGTSGNTGPGDAMNA